MTRSRPISTWVGDVLVLRTKINSLPIHAVGVVSKDGQQDFSGHRNVTYVKDRAAAMLEATAQVQPGRRIVMWNLDTRECSVVLHGGMTHRQMCDPRNDARPAKADLKSEPRVVRTS